jgi:hypothetical protein
MQPVLLGSAHRFAIFRQPPCFTGRGAGEGRLRATSGLSHGQAGGLSLTQSGPSVSLRRLSETAPRHLQTMLQCPVDDNSSLTRHRTLFVLEQ